MVPLMCGQTANEQSILHICLAGIHRGMIADIVCLKVCALDLDTHTRQASILPLSSILVLGFCCCDRTP